MAGGVPSEAEPEPELSGVALGAGVEAPFFCSNLRKICRNKSSESTTNSDLICPFSSGLTRRRMVVISEVEKLHGNLLTASTKLYT